MKKKFNNSLLRMILRKKIHGKKQEHAVTEMLSTFILLMIVVIVFAAISYFLFSLPQPTPTPTVTILGRMENNSLILEHHGGESIDLDSTIKLSFLSYEPQILAYDYVDAQAKEDGMWGFGELLSYPLFNYPDYLKIQLVDIMIINDEPDASVMHAAIPIDPATDLALNMTVNEQHPQVNTSIVFNLTVRNIGNLNVTGITIRFKLPEGLDFVSFSTTNGNYDPATGIWIYYGTLEPGKSVTLYVTAFVTGANPKEFTQLLIIQDSSGSIGGADWNNVISAYMAVIGNASVCPRNSVVELTFVEFGAGGTGKISAIVKIPPTTITNDSIGSILWSLNNLKNNTMLGGTTTSCGCYCGTNATIHSTNFTPGNRQVVLLVADGKISSVYCEDDGDYITDGGGGGRPAALRSRNNLIAEFGMTSNEDEIDAIAVGISNDKVVLPWFMSKWAWPQPGYLAPPFKIDLPKQGFVVSPKDWKEVPGYLTTVLTNILNSQRISAGILSAGLTDPRYSNNFDYVIIVPED